jgi:hypothetical protein
MTARNPAPEDRNSARSSAHLGNHEAKTKPHSDHERFRRDSINGANPSKLAASTQAVIERHLGAFAAGNLDLLMSDYTDTSVLFTANGTLVGPGAIRGFMTAFFAEFAKPGASFEMRTMHVASEVGFIVWSAETADNVYELATDTFVVRDEKIAFQSFVGKVVPRSKGNGEDSRARLTAEGTSQRSRTT